MSQQVSLRRKVGVSGSQQESGRNSLSVSARRNTGNASLAQSRSLRCGKLLSRAWHGQRFAFGQNLGDIGQRFFVGDLPEKSGIRAAFGPGFP